MILSKEDSICRWFDFKKDDIIKITRINEGIEYRKVN